MIHIIQATDINNMLGMTDPDNNPAIVDRSLSGGICFGATIELLRNPLTNQPIVSSHIFFRAMARQRILDDLENWRLPESIVTIQHPAKSDRSNSSWL